MRLYLYLISFSVLSIPCLADDSKAKNELPSIETFITEPAVIDNVSIWVPAERSGPFINRSCRIKKGLGFSFALPASVKHRKSEYCPNEIARIIAELISFYFSRSLPLTIFNGWQWEYKYSMSQYEMAKYNLPERGGCWENCWEAILNFGYGAIQLRKLNIESSEKFSIDETLLAESVIEVRTFSSMRTRDGYPKERQL